MDRARKAAAEAASLREISKPEMVRHGQRRHSHEQLAPAAPPAPASSSVDRGRASAAFLPKSQPSSRSTPPASKSSSCPLQSLREGLASASSAQRLRSCLRIAPAGTPESEKAAHLLASFKQKDEESLRKERRKMRNRLAAAKSNERRREKLEAQKKELEDLKERVHTLKTKRVVVEQENEKLKSSLREKQKDGDGASSSAMSDISQGK